MNLYDWYKLTSIARFKELHEINKSIELAEAAIDYHCVNSNVFLSNIYTNFRNDLMATYNQKKFWWMRGK